MPVEFKSRAYLKENPIHDFIGFGAWNQPPGTFSDDSSMTFCTMESLCFGLNTSDIANKFVTWYKSGYWGAHNKLFDIGNTTRHALDRIIEGWTPDVSGGFEDYENGNGSLMRIFPIVFFLKNEPNIKNRLDTIRKVSQITHAHFRSVFACFLYIEFTLSVLERSSILDAYKHFQDKVNSFVSEERFNPEELKLFDRILRNNIYNYPEESIRSSGYVIDTLESSLFCFLTSQTYKETVLKAVNLGGDTDTTGAVAGALAGFYYGFDAIPNKLIEKIAKKQEIESLAIKFYTSLTS